MLENSTPRFVRGYLGDKPEAKTAANGNVYAVLSISVSHYVGKDAEGKSQYKTEWVEARAFDNQYDKTASLVLADGSGYVKGAPVLVLLNQGIREDTNLFYKDRSGNIQPFKNPVIRPDYTVEEIGLWAKEKRGQGNQTAAAPAAQAQAPVQQASQPAANDAF